MYTIVEHAQDLDTEVERARDLRTLGWGCPIFWRQFEVYKSMESAYNDLAQGDINRNGDRIRRYKEITSSETCF